MKKAFSLMTVKKYIPKKAENRDKEEKIIFSFQESACECKCLCVSFPEYQGIISITETKAIHPLFKDEVISRTVNQLLKRLVREICRRASVRSVHRKMRAYLTLVFERLPNL